MNRKFLSLIPVCVMLVGCTTVNTVENADKVGEKQMIADKRVLTDSSLSRRIQVVGLNVDESAPGGLLKVQAEIFNNSRNRQAFNYLWEWFDQAGMVVATPMTTGTTREIEGKDTIHIVGTAPNARARDFKLRLIEAR
jgi:uncharacterized protein YcfL